MTKTIGSSKFQVVPHKHSQRDHHCHHRHKEYHLTASTDTNTTCITPSKVTNNTWKVSCSCSRDPGMPTVVQMRGWAWPPGSAGARICPRACPRDISEKLGGWVYPGPGCARDPGVPGTGITESRVHYGPGSKV